MRVGWLADERPDDRMGGAERTQAEFKAAAPAGVEVVRCPAGKVVPGLDRYVVHNCVLYERPEFEALNGAPVIKYWHDVGPWLKDGVREWLDAHATPICCSPLQADYMRMKGVATIPPPVDLTPFEAVSDSEDRHGIVSVGSWRNYGKAPHRVAEWAAVRGGVDFFGDGVFAPNGAVPVPYEDLPGVLACYRTFAFLPIVIEPFGRAVVEAWAAGCELVINGLVGSRYWIEEAPDQLRGQADRFWELVLNA